MAILIRFHVSKSSASRARRLSRLLVCAALAVVVVAPAVSSASPQQEVQTITRLAADVNSADPKVRRAALKALATGDRRRWSRSACWSGIPSATSAAAPSMRSLPSTWSRRHARASPARRTRFRMDSISNHAHGRCRPHCSPISCVLLPTTGRRCDGMAAYTLGVVMTPPIDDPSGRRADLLARRRG